MAHPGGRLRHRPGAECGRRAASPRPASRGHAGIYEPGAGSGGPQPRCADRRVQPGHGALRDAGGGAAVHRGHGPDVLAKRFTSRPRGARGAPQRSRKRRAGDPEALAPVPADRFAPWRSSRRRSQSATPRPALTAPPRRLTAAELRCSGGDSAGRRPPSPDWRWSLGILIGLGALRLAPAARRRRRGHRPAALAVLPFENLGDSADAYFADGVTDEVRASSRQVRPRSHRPGSSNEYRGNEQAAGRRSAASWGRLPAHSHGPLGKGRGRASRVRVTPGAGRRPAGPAPHPRGSSSTPSLTNVFQVQADIATKVADALDLALGDSVPPTGGPADRDLEAYDAFLKGEAARAGSTLRHPEPPASLGLTTTRGDARFRVRAGLGQLSRVASPLTAIGPHTGAGGQARHAAERARRLGPTRPEGFWRSASTPVVARDSRQALAAFEAGLELAPSNVELIVAVGAIERHWKLGGGTRAIRARRGLDPRSPTRPGYTPWPSSICAAIPRRRLRRLGPSPWRPATCRSSTRARCSRSPRETSPGRSGSPARSAGRGPAEQAVLFARFEELAWLLSDAQQRQLLTLPLSAFEGDRANWVWFGPSACAAG